MDIRWEGKLKRNRDKKRRKEKKEIEREKEKKGKEKEKRKNIACFSGRNMVEGLGSPLSSPSRTRM